MNILREKIKNGEKTCGTLVSLTDPALCEIMGIVGYDYIWAISPAVVWRAVSRTACALGRPCTVV